jgi:hypothetical protein
MIEIFEIFWTAKIELRVVILATLIMGCFWYWQDNKRKQKDKHQERLNQIDLDDDDWRGDLYTEEQQKRTKEMWKKGEFKLDE